MTQRAEPSDHQFRIGHPLATALIERAKGRCYQFGGFGVARLEVDAVEHDNDHPLAVAGGGHAMEKPGLGEIAGLEPVTALDAAEEMVVGAHGDGFTPPSLPGRKGRSLVEV